MSAARTQHATAEGGAAGARSGGGRPPAPRPFWVAGQPRAGHGALTVRSPWDDSPVGAHGVPGPQDVEDAVAAASAVAESFASCPVHVRADALAAVSAAIAARSAEIADLITAENGKPIRWSRLEVARAVSVFRLAAEEARRLDGTVQRLDTDPSGVGRLALTTRHPRGPVLAIAPFNFPLNLVAHKVAPALAVGAPVVVKPAPATPLTALLLGDLLADTGLPAGSWSVLPVGNEVMSPLVMDSRLPVVSFTGSDAVGWPLLDSVPRKHVVLELGGNAGVLVTDDWAATARPGDGPDVAVLAAAADRIATFATYQAGQSCIAIQRIYVDDSVAEEFLPLLTDAFSARRTGDPRLPDTEVGPMTSADAARRVQAWVQEAVAAGARVLCGGGPADGATYPPTLLTDCPPDARVVRDEVFGPVAVVERVDGFEAGLDALDDTRFGLQAGVFTRRTDRAFRARDRLHAGGVVVGDVPSYRADQVAYGGQRASGTGREGVRSAMADLTVERSLVLSGLLG